MIDQALGWNAPARRRRQDNTSQNSNQQVTEPIRQPISRQTPKRVYAEQATAKTEESQPTSSLNASTRSRTRNNVPAINTSSRVQNKHTFEQEISSPQIRNKNMAKVVQPSQMASSSRQLTTSSIRIAEENKKKEEQQRDKMYKLKMVIFLIISLFLMFQVMSPSRKVPYKSKK